MGAVEFIICHAEVTLAFVEAKKIPEVLKTFPKAGEYLKIAPEQKEQREGFGVAIHSWEEFLSLGDDKQFDLPLKKKSDISGVHRLLGSADASLDSNDVYLSFLPLAHIFDRVIEEYIGELKPTMFCVVPRVLDRIYSGAGHLGSVISSVGRWRMRLEVPRAEIDEMLPLARLVSRSTDPDLQSRSKVAICSKALSSLGLYKYYMISGDGVPHYLNVDLALGDIRVAKCIKSDYPCVPLEKAQGTTDDRGKAPT
ncbi:unnamed protein product [Lactuca saligna]|uniref:4-coumarate--CoA ligase n=1 Tax=Lactuca saligna TaxID=75948 RepID=A0AA36EJK0_LACSI|nr:unnamed protein product [Lactuca saligna]